MVFLDYGRFCCFDVDFLANAALLRVLHRTVACSALVMEGDYGVMPYKCFNGRESTKVISVVESGLFGFEFHGLTLAANVACGP